jgi:hypothetical protein
MLAADSGPAQLIPLAHETARAGALRNDFTVHSAK